ncbi:MAG: hypothetical protein A2451_01650 [Bdellovibrionales bacterium RIFOXYC2_FULL_39_8]|nr:MAG: hypothetical protein A2451_01650 [Bdellovibrionales bacterium RIFOXYC2_FULL_39_8]OGQ88196.1 MAG: hypothetical protein A2512_02530 [Deltaproteobacteria bacterium RIFOXYD12_FULL_56_24]
MKKTMLALAMVCAFGLAVTINEGNAVAASGESAAPAKKVTAQTTAPAPTEAPAPVAAPTPKKKKAIEGC